MSGSPRRNRIALIFLASFLILLSVAVGFTIFALSSDRLGQAVVEAIVYQLEAPPGNDSSEVDFVIYEGETAAEIASRLQREGLIRNALLFNVLARSRGLDDRLEAGEHRLRRNMRLSEVLTTLQRAEAQQRWLTVLEGWRAVELGDELEFRGISSKDDFLALVASDDWPHDFLRERPPGTTLEGYLFPDTYALKKDITAREIVEEMLANFERRVLPAWANRPPSLDLTLHETLTLASIVEREAQVAAERPLIAGVFLNRLRIGMPLQADPTVQYALVESSLRPPDGYWKKGLTWADLGFSSPYNTYQNTGLPPAPICSPGLASIEAVLHPEETDYFYFVAKGDGSHAFARTLDEHNENVRLYR